VNSKDSGVPDTLLLTGHMSDDVEHFYSESCTCHMMSNNALSVNKMISESIMLSRFTTVHVGFQLAGDHVHV
jgi:hypothetical protein